jgi:tripartite-type tricarboxylate transporter receptor subunit TctC
MAVLLFSAAAVAQGYPSRAVRIVVPFPAGGPLDFTARLLADKLSVSMKQPFVVENRPGAAGNLGADAVAKAAPDGYTLLLVLDTPLTVNPWLYARLAFDPVRDFAPISTVASFSLTLVVNPSVPVNSVAEFVAYAKTRKEKPLLYGSGGGPGNPGHLAMEYFRMQAGFEGVHVPYKGNSEVVMGLIGRQIEAGFLATPGVLPNVREGQLKALAVSNPQRIAIATDIPTVAESGYPGFEVGFYQVLLAPAGTPESVRTLLEREVRHSLQSPELQERFRVQALEPVASSAADTSALLKRVTERWQTVVRTANIRLD